MLAYIPRGGFFGEIGLLGGGVRTATCSALDHVELVRISGDDFRRMVDTFPAIRAEFERVAARARSHRTVSDSRRPIRVELNDFLVQGLMQAQSLLVLDLEKCTRCDQCVNGVRRCARRRHAAGPRRAAVRQVPGRDVVPSVPRSVVHGRLSGRRRSAGAIRSKSSSKTGASAAACARAIALTGISRTCTRSRSKPPTRRSLLGGSRRHAQKGDRLRLVHRARRAELRVRMPARRRSSRRAVDVLRVEVRLSLEARNRTALAHLRQQW